MSLIQYSIYVLVLGTLGNFLLSSKLNIDIFKFFILLLSGQLPHFLDKRKLVIGDLVLIKFQGKYRKAYVRTLSVINNRVQLIFSDKHLNRRELENNWYDYDRIVIPDKMSKIAKLLYTERED